MLCETSPTDLHGRTRTRYISLTGHVSDKLRSVFVRENPWLLTKTLQRFCFVFIVVEDCQQFCNHQQVLNTIRQFEQPQLPTLTGNSRVVCDQLADAARVDVTHAREIQQDLLLARVGEVPN